MRKIPLSQGKFAVVDDEDFDWLNQWKWCVRKDGKTFYAMRTDRSGSKQKTVNMHNFIMGTPKGFQTDHLNHDGLDNRRRNLRIVTHRENQLNPTGLRKDNTSGVPNVHWHKLSKKWSATRRVDGKRIHVGYFISKDDALSALANLKKV